ncbi:hypothetical protein LCER1_G006907 [Lachnellula cervina]|uniref:Zn(2)-C6 fungal-type domain-containing protein n=1 Tax=Lachnellula cervina TaxID=1316786 RepID=A0A7D8Z3P6_9HELO|nr:hypothetical protein LCER1_G006907 [Lachnellula cervina]
MQPISTNVPRIVIRLDDMFLFYHPRNNSKRVTGRFCTLKRTGKNVQPIHACVAPCRAGKAEKETKRGSEVQNRVFDMQHINMLRIRRVKCDETKPSCTPCTKTGRVCDFINPQEATSSVRASKPPTTVKHRLPYSSKPCLIQPRPHYPPSA